MKNIVKKKILITIDWFLPGTKSGGPVRSYKNLIDHFGNEHDFYLITRDTDYCETIPYKSIKSNCWNEYNDCLKVYYVSANNLNYLFLKSLFKSIDFDIILINGIYSWYFSILPLLILKSESLKKIVSPRGMLNSQAFSSKQNKKKLFLILSKCLGLYKSVFFHATNSLEAICIKNELGSKTKVIIASNLPRLVTKRKQKSGVKKEGILNLVSTARISKEKGTLKAIQGILAFATSKEVKINFHLYGTLYDLKYWKQCKAIIKSLPTHIKVVYKGNLASEEVPGTLENYDFLLMPSEGENFGHAILEALSVGTPVIISDNTPWRNLKEKKIGWDVSLTNPLNLQDVINTAINMKQEVYSTWSENAFDFATEFINNKDIIQENKALFKN